MLEIHKEKKKRGKRGEEKSFVIEKERSKYKNMSGRMQPVAYWTESRKKKGKKGREI